MLSRNFGQFLVLLTTRILEMEIIKRIDGNDILILIGFGLTGYGIYLIWPPLTPLILGALMLIIGLFGAFRKGADR